MAEAFIKPMPKLEVLTVHDDLRLSASVYSILRRSKGVGFDLSKNILENITWNMQGLDPCPVISLSRI